MMSKITEIQFSSKERYKSNKNNIKQKTNNEIKVLKFINDKPVKLDGQGEKDLYYNEGVGNVALYNLFYPKNIMKFIVIEKLFTAKAIENYCKNLTLVDFLRLYEKQQGRLRDRLIIINNADFILAFYKNPGKYCRTFVSKNNYNLLIALHTIAVDTTLFRLTSELNSNAIKESVFCCVLHVLLLEQLLPPIVNEKHFVIEIRKRLFLCIKYVIKQKKLFINLNDFFKVCMLYYQENKKELALKRENLNAIDLRFQRYIMQMQEN